MSFTEYHTKKGTILPLITLKGKPYLQVAHRIQWFREDHPDWRINTEIVRIDDKMCIFKAFITNSEGKILSIAHKREDQTHFPDFMEKAETGAIGRALAMVGYGTQFCADELDEKERLADAPISPGRSQVPTPKVTPITTATTQPKGISDSQRKLLWARLKRDLNLTDEKAKEFLSATTGKAHSSEYDRNDFDLVMSEIDRLGVHHKEPIFSEDEDYA